MAAAGRAAAVLPLLMPLLVLPAAPALASTEVEFLGSSGATTREGHATLDWEPQEGRVFEVEKATRADFSDARRLHRGHGHALFVSGLEQGSNWFRIRAIGDDGVTPGPWSPPFEVVVAYPTRAEVIGLMAVGFAVFLILVTIIISSFLRDRRTPGKEVTVP